MLTARAAESVYARRLNQVARQIDAIVKGLAPEGSPTARQIERIRSALEQYAVILTPWAESVASYMVAEIGRRNERAWRSMSEEIGKALVVELTQAPTGRIFDDLMREQVKLIRSIPLDMAQRVHELTIAGMTEGRRASSVAAEIMRTGEVARSKAMLIARTETSRTASNFVQARATYAGSEGYIWRTSEDGDVRPTHRAQNGKYIRWTNPPKTDKGLAPYHAGCGPNCRCYPDPQF